MTPTPEQPDLLSVADDHLTQVHANADTWWRDSAERALRDLAASGRTFEAYDLTEMGVPDPDHPNRWGALFRAAHTAGLIEPVGYAQSRRPGRSGGLTRLWRGVAR